MKINAVIFDLDGVLLSTDVFHYLAWKKLADEIGINNFSEEDAIRQRGVSRMASLEILLEKRTVNYSETEKIELADKKNRYYIEMLNKLGKESILPGVFDSLSLLKKNGIKLAVGSASKNAPIILNKTGINHFFDAVVSGADVKKSKPDPQVFCYASDKLLVSVEHCLVVEDSYAGIEAAKRGGMLSYAVGTAQKSPFADFSSENMIGFLKFIEKNIDLFEKVRNNDK